MQKWKEPRVSKCNNCLTVYH